MRASLLRETACWVTRAECLGEAPPTNAAGLAELILGVNCVLRAWPAQAKTASTKASVCMLRNMKDMFTPQQDHQKGSTSQAKLA
mmetsp:Transcript_76951/g.133147  ORF Transcript_76951/g.133147 Transcript_76951/m.133147 type:complete len:85 (+) Transcript_76951:221-475(+)